MINILILDDEELSRKSIIKSIENFDEFKNKLTIYQAESTIEAEKILNNIKIQILLLDIEMPNENGIDFLVRLKKPNFKVIIITAYQEFAISAFKQNALAYILKPIIDEELLIALKKCFKAIHLVKNRQYYKNILELTKTLSNNKIAIPTIEGFEMIDIDSILYMTADGNYSIIFTKTNKILSSKSLKYFELRLPNTLFIRIHDAHIININKTLKYVKGNGGYIVMENQQHLDVSVRRKKNLMQFLK